MKETILSIRSTYRLTLVLAGLIAVVAISHDPREIDSAIAELNSAVEFLNIPYNKRPISSSIFYYPEFIPEFENIISNFENTFLENGLGGIKILLKPRIPRSSTSVRTKNWDSYRDSLKEYKHALSSGINSNYFFISLFEVKRISKIVNQIITTSKTPINNLVLNIDIDFDGKILPAVIPDSNDLGIIKSGKSLLIELTGTLHDGKQVRYPIIATALVIDKKLSISGT